MTRAQVIISQLFLLLFMTQAKTKFLLVKTENNKISEKKMGEDYGMPPDSAFSVSIHAILIAKWIALKTLPLSPNHIVALSVHHPMQTTLRQNLKVHRHIVVVWGYHKITYKIWLWTWEGGVWGSHGASMPGGKGQANLFAAPGVPGVEDWSEARVAARRQRNQGNNCFDNLCVMCEKKVWSYWTLHDL